MSSAYLALEKKVDLDEVVLVLPVDPYADIEYFFTLLQMEEAVKLGVADIALMGIKPTYPSEKYGYIAPVKEEDLSGCFSIHKVERFTEKPMKAVAEQLIAGGAFVIVKNSAHSNNVVVPDTNLSVAKFNRPTTDLIQ